MKYKQQHRSSGSRGEPVYWLNEPITRDRWAFNTFNRARHNVLDLSDGAVIASDESETDNTENVERDSESCLRPRRNSDAVVKSYFKCGGYNSVHWRCGDKYCADCIEEAILQEEGLPLFSKCNTNNVEAYAQIDKGPNSLVQVNYLNEIVSGVPNATFILTFRDMTNWYRSLTNWQSIHTSEINMRRRFEWANITGLPKGVGRNVSEFTHFYCEYVKRVREEVAKYPGRHELIEIDIEDPTVGWQMEEAFGINRTCWGKKNTAKHNGTLSEEELQ
eukprot:scaffold30419_cov154-Skeletonema_menzelii.AAC.5